VSTRERAIIMPSPLNFHTKVLKFNAKFWHTGIFTPSGAETDQNSGQWLKTSSLIGSSVFRLRIFVNTPFFVNILPVLAEWHLTSPLCASRFIGLQKRRPASGFCIPTGRYTESRRLFAVRKRDVRRQERSFTLYNLYIFNFVVSAIFSKSLSL
jgi:hypothetical protein